MLLVWLPVWREPSDEVYEWMNMEQEWLSTGEREMGQMKGQWSATAGK